MEMKIRFAGNKKVAAEFEGFTVMTDQPQSGGGDGSAPAPFDLFLASIGTCAGIFINSFCRKREIPLEGIEIIQSMEWNEETHLVSKISLDIRVPASFPVKYLESLKSAANLCTVKKHLATPPQFELKATVV
jgi:putative redox protein